jgi:poly-gamma-glutamate synthase PgsB/CapB
MLIRNHLPLMVLGAIFAATLAYMFRERSRHQKNLDAIALRILVNGSRGKSSTTRLIRAALAADRNRVTAAKTTGSAARFIAPAGREFPIIRKNSIVNVIEQIAVVARAVVFKAHTFVVECMAVDPGLQELNTEVLIQPHLVVITNVRPDHLDEMGGPDRDVAGVARSLCRSMPKGGICVTAESDPDLLAIMREEAETRGTVLYYADPADVTDAEMSHFPWICFPDNVAIALVIARLYNVPRGAALAGMYAAQPDPGVLRVDEQQHSGRKFKAVNLFAANDPASTLQNLALLRKRGLVSGGISLVINCRPDRLERNGQMGSIVEAAHPELVFLIGHPTKSASDHIPAHLHDRIVAMEGDAFTGEAVLEAIAQRIPDDPQHAIVLVGNIHGAGEGLLHALHNSAYEGPTLDEELQQLTDTRIENIPTAGLDPTLVWRDSETLIIPEPVGPMFGPEPAGARTEELDLRDIRALEQTRKLFLPR